MRKTHKALLVFLAATLLMLPAEALATIRCVEDQSGSDDHDKIQNGIDASSRGDILIFGSDCSATYVYAKPKTYTVGKWTASAIDQIELKHAVTYLGMGSTIKLADRPGGVTWPQWKSIHTFNLNDHTSDTQTTPYAYPTVLIGFRFDGNYDGQDYEHGVDDESKQRALFVDAADLTSGRQDVIVGNCEFVDTTWGGLVIHHDVDVEAIKIRNEDAFHGVQFVGSESILALSDLVSTGGAVAVKVEPAYSVSVGNTVTIDGAVISGTSGRGIEWSTDTGGDNSLTIKNATITCPDAMCVLVAQFDTAVLIEDSTLTADSTENALQFSYIGESATVKNTTITGYVNLSGASLATWDDSTDSITFDGVTWNGAGLGVEPKAINSTQDDERVIKLEDCEPGSNQHILSLRGGTAYIDTATIAACDGSCDEDEVIYQWGAASYPATVYWRQGETNPGSNYSESAQWCGDNPPSGDCNW